MRTGKANFPLTLFTILICTISLACASSNPPTSTATLSSPDSIQNNEVSNINKKLLTRSSEPRSLKTDYILGPKDLVEVKVLEAEKLTTQERVSADGIINLPLLNNVNVSGLTPIEAEEKIEMLLKNGGFINNPHVSVFVTEAKSNTVLISGYVENPGTYELIGDVTLLDALAMAGGLDRQDAGTIVYISRDTGDKRENLIVDLDDLFEGTNSYDQSGILINTGDVIYVPEAANVFVDGAIYKPGAYPIQNGETTLSEVITLAGGVLSYADAGDISLIRYKENNNREISQYDLNSIRDGIMQDPILDEKDTIIVGASGFKQFIYGFSFSFFGTGVGYRPPAR